jgi:hypothetical protein
VIHRISPPAVPARSKVKSSRRRGRGCVSVVASPSRSATGIRSRTDQGAAVTSPGMQAADNKALLPSGGSRQPA